MPQERSLRHRLASPLPPPLPLLPSPSPPPRAALRLLALSSLVLPLAACGSFRSAADPAPATGSQWHYEAVADEGARELRVEARFPAGTLTDLGVMHGAEPYIVDVEVVREGRWHSVPRRDGGWNVPECAGSGCRVRYRVKLADAARAFVDVDRARRFDGVTVARPAMWLMHPTFARRGARYRLHVVTPPGTRFATGIFPASDGAADTYEAEASLLPSAPYTAFGALEVRRIDYAGAEIVVASQPGALGATNANVDRWVAESARAVGAYFGCFPVPRASIVIVPTDGDEVQRGHALGDGGAGVVVEIGRQAKDAALVADWVMPHELVHLGFPSVARTHHWLEEGLATYVQPIALARAGIVPPERVWSDFARRMPHGLPRAHDQGLDHTESWGRTYWGGALFFFVADVEIRRRSGNRFSIDDALRGIVGAGGNISVEWDIVKVLDAGDRAVGVPVLRELYEKMANRPQKIDLATYWRALGVAPRGASNGRDAAFDDAAPLAALRRSITLPHTDDGVNVAACPSEGVGATRMARKLR